MEQIQDLLNLVSFGVMIEIFDKLPLEDQKGRKLIFYWMIDVFFCSFELSFHFGKYFFLKLLEIEMRWRDCRVGGFFFLVFFIFNDFLVNFPDIGLIVQEYAPEFILEVAIFMGWRYAFLFLFLLTLQLATFIQFFTLSFRFTHWFANFV